MATRLVYHTPESAAGGVSPFDSVLMTIVPGQDIWIASPYLDLDYLKRLIGHSRSWHLVTDLREWMKSRPDARVAIQTFVEANVERIRSRESFHAKVCIAGNSALAGSANFTRAGIRHNVEFSLCLENEPDLVRELRDWMHSQWGQAQPVDLDQLKAHVQKLHSVPAIKESQPRTSLHAPTPRIRASLLKIRQHRCPDCGLATGEIDTRTGKPARFYKGATYCTYDQQQRQQRTFANPLHRCPDCKLMAGEIDERTGKPARFYNSATYCVYDQRLRQKASLAKPQIRQAIKQINRRSQTNNPESVARGRKAYAERMKMKRRAARPADMLPLAEVAQELGLTRQRVHQYHKDKRLIGVRRGGGPKRPRLWFKREDVERLKREREQENE